MCVQETRWKGDRTRRLVGWYKLLHAGGVGRSNGVGVIVLEEISKDVVRVERWVVMAWLVIQKPSIHPLGPYSVQIVGAA